MNVKPSRKLKSNTQSLHFSNMVSQANTEPLPKSSEKQIKSVIIKKNINEEEMRQEQQNILLLNHWKHKKSQTYSQQSLRKMFSKGGVLQDERTENSQFPSPNINTKLLMVIDNESMDINPDRDTVPFEEEGAENDSIQQEKKIKQMKLLQKFENNDIRPIETQETMKKHLNKNLVNKIVFNKLAKRMDKIPETQTEQKVDQDVFNSFKNLTSMFKSVIPLINYEQIYNKILHEQNFPQSIVIISKEFDKDLQRQQQNFNEIVFSKQCHIKVLEKLMKLTIIFQEQQDEVKQKKKKLHELRIDGCQLRDQLKLLQTQVNLVINQFYFSKMEDMNKKYLKNVMQLYQQEERSNQSRIEKMRQMEVNKHQFKFSIFKKQLKENDRLLNESLLKQINNYQTLLQQNIEDIEVQERFLKHSQSQKSQHIQELDGFLKTILKNEDIQIQDSLITIIKLLLSLKSTLSIADFPNFLDTTAKNYLMQLSQAEFAAEEVKKKIKYLQQQSYANQQGKELQQERDAVFGYRFIFEKKLKRIHEKFQELKKEKCVKRKIVDTGGKLKDRDKKATIIQLNNFPDLASKHQFDFINMGKINYSQNFLHDDQMLLQDYEKQAANLTKNELYRLKVLTQTKQLSGSQIQKLVKTVQSEFGVKRMNLILREIIIETKFVQQKQIFYLFYKDSTLQRALDNDTKKLKQEVIMNKQSKALEQVKEFQEKIEMNKKLEAADLVNYNYDPTYNDLKTLQNKYASSSFYRL